MSSFGSSNIQISYSQIDIYSTTKETHQSLLHEIMENRMKK